jgi:hypothetical protein
VTADHAGAPSIDELIEASDLDALIVLIDRLCAAADWDGLVGLRDRCRAAGRRGLRVWPVASHAEYRLALEAPGPWAAAVVQPDAGHLSLGPLAEVAACHHRWADLVSHLPAGPLVAICAQECVVRGEDLTDAGVDPQEVDVPLVLEPWEPEYPLANYEPHRAEFPFPALPEPRERRRLRGETVRGADDGPCRELVELANTWTTQSNGRAEAATATGDAIAGLRALGIATARLAELTPSAALALMAWTAASGGAHGRRRGMAAGRFGAWWAAASLTGLVDRWPVEPLQLGEAVASLRWYRWDTGTPDKGWACRLVVEDPRAGRAWAVSATDAV